MMRLYGAIQKVEPLDDGTVRVHGIATSEAVDDQGETVSAEAMRAAIPDYMRFPALREMHQLSAAGTTLEAEVCEDGATRIVAHVVDPIAVAKVKNQVYRGFSIGGRVTQREPGNPNTITSLVLNEISLVDRPANPEAIFDCWKATCDPSNRCTGVGANPATRGSTSLIPAMLTKKPFNTPFQVWACGVPNHRHLTKAEALKCLETEAAEPTVTQVTEETSSEGSDRAGEGQYADPGYQTDGRKRYLTDTNHHIRAAWDYINRPGNARKYTGDQHRRIKAAITAAWREIIGGDGPPSLGEGQKNHRLALTKALQDVGCLTRLIADLEWLKDAISLDVTVEEDNSPYQEVLQAIAELCGFLSELLAKETGEKPDNAEMDDLPLPAQGASMLAMAAGIPGRTPAAAHPRKGSPDMRKLGASIFAEAEYLQGDQMLMDMAHRACDKSLTVGGLSAEQEAHIVEASKQLRQAGAVQLSPTGEDAIAIEQLDVLEIIADVIVKMLPAGQMMMSLAHDCIGKLSAGTVCGEVATVEAPHSSEVMQYLQTAHGHLVAAGARCGAMDADSAQPRIDDEQLDGGFEPGESEPDHAQALAGERAEKAALAKALAEIVPALERLSKRVDDIARTPLPPLTIAKGVVSVSKQQDRGITSGSGPELSPEAVASAFAKMSKEEQTLTLIKASYANPIRVHGATAKEA